MSIVKFPGLGLEFNISKYAMKFFNVYIYKYAVCIVLGVVLALLLMKISKEKFGIKYEFVLDSMLGAIVFGIIGARIYYVIFNISKYIDNPGNIINLRDGGLAIYGGIIASALYLIIKCKNNKVSFLDLSDYLIPYLALGQSIGRWGNFFNVEAYGIQTHSILRMGIETIDAGYIEVHPVFFYESISTFLIFIILKNLQKNRKFKGQILFLYFILYGFVRMFLEGLRIDSLMILNIRISQLLSFIIFVVFSCFYIINNRKNIIK